MVSKQMQWSVWMAGMVLAGMVAVATAEMPPRITTDDGAEMVLVPAGPFLMGTGEADEIETPPHTVDLPSYYIDVTEVTNGQYARYVAQTGAKPPAQWDGRAPAEALKDLPIGNISWFDAMRYAIWAGKRLPTEAEWEKAARGTDGRRYPWGQIDDRAKRNRSLGGFHAKVGSYPDGESPYGCLDMSGNVWEWTADWLDAYPGSAAKSIFFGREYKVIRGAGGEYLYGAANRGDCTQRARLLPYGAHDFVGFRCVKDADPAKPAYDPQERLAEAEGLLNASLREPVRLSYETLYNHYLSTKRFPMTVEGPQGYAGMVRAGIPMPKGAITQLSDVAVLGEDGRPKPVQVTELSPWDDGSARWVCVDFEAKAGEQCEVDFTGKIPPIAPEVAIEVSGDAKMLTVATGEATIEITPKDLIQAIRDGEGNEVFGAAQLRFTAEEQRRPVRWMALPAEDMGIEELGPLHTVIRLRGRLGRSPSEPTDMRYDVRIHARAGSPRVNLMVTLTHDHPRQGGDDPVKKPSPLIVMRDASLMFSMPGGTGETVVGTDRGTERLGKARDVGVRQVNDLKYVVTREREVVAEGTRSPGWLAVEHGNRWAVLGVRYFWQNHPAMLVAEPKAVGVQMWAGDEPFVWEATLAKSHELVLDVTTTEPRDVVLDPMRISMPPAWACETQSAGGPLLARSRESITRFPYWESMREHSMRQWVRGMPTGFRDFGDGYMGGPHKGKNAYCNLEYDVHMNFLLQYLRTGQTWYLRSAEPMARHQADIDTDHVTGQPYKHSPGHTTTRSDIGHMFVRGLLLHYVLTGERRSLDVAHEIGTHLSHRTIRTRGYGNERQIGWGLYALTGLYETTREQRYIDAAEALGEVLTLGQAPTGRFAIRYDNRIAFLNGIAMNGLLSVERQTKSTRLARTLMRVCRRTLGLYPEYACRTLNGFCWAVEQTNDPRFLDMIERTWQQSMEYLRSSTTSATHSWHFTHMAAKRRLFPLFKDEPGECPEPRSWKSLHVDKAKVQCFLRADGRDAGPVLVVQEGLANGRVEVFGPQGRAIQTWDLDDTSELFQPALFTIPADGQVYSLRLTSDGARAWEVHTDARTDLVLHSLKGENLHAVYPRAYGCIRDDAEDEIVEEDTGRRDAEGKKIKVKKALEGLVIKFLVEGEGFHTATLYNPDGEIVATTREFIDFQDPGRYEMVLKAHVPARPGPGWGLEVYKAEISSIKGFLPYWSGEAEEWFNPERPGA